MTQALCKISEIGEKGKEVMLSGAPGKASYLMLFLLGSEVKAYQNSCPHQGRNLNWAPDRFMITAEQQLVCAHHGACFDLRTGLCVQGPCEGSALTAVAVEIKDQQVWLSGSASLSRN